MDNDALAPFKAFGPAILKPLSRVQKIVAKRMERNWATIPHVTHGDDADVTALEAHRAAADPASRCSALAYIIKAVALEMRAWPQFNASLSEVGDALVLKDYVNIGVAVDVSGGLLVPVLRDCDVRSVREIGAELREVSSEARDRGLPFERMAGGCFTISSLGGIGGTGFTPIINAPEVAILGVSRTRVTPVWDGRAFEPRSLTPLSLSYDHRVINGADAARFCRGVADRLADPAALEA